MTTRKPVIDGKSSGLGASKQRSSMHNHAIMRYLVACMLAALVSGCAITKDYQPPQVEVPQGWRVEYEAAAELANTAWWESFQDPVLNRLIKTALNENKDLRIAAARVEEAAAGIQAARSEFFPQVGYGGSAGRRQESEELIYPFGTLVDRTNNRFQGFLNASWELDVWGRIRRSTEAARADYLSTEEARRGVILTLVSAVASGYLELLSLDKQLQVARKTVKFREEWLELFEKKKKGGQISELELIQVRSSYEQALPRIPVIEMQIAMQENALSVLLGRNPGPIERGKTLEALGMPGIPEGVPSDVLLQRPDIRRSEENLIAANARVGVARTLYFPSISLTGLFGYASSDLSNLAKSTANIWEVGGGLLGPIFTGGLIQSEIKQSEARYTQLLNEYLRTIQTAFKEVNDALVSRQKFNELLLELDKLVDTLEDYADFSRKSFDAGFSSYLTVLDAEEKLFFAQLRQAGTQSSMFIALTGIYRAMGGGWVAAADKLITEPAQQTEKTAVKK
jgi:multidrug efflux system outer membrane protein